MRVAGCCANAVNSGLHKIGNIRLSVNSFCAYVPFRTDSPWAVALTGAAEAQLAEAVAANAKLQAEVDQLNDTVFSKTFRAPSAWAEREVKYKMDKKAWDTQVSSFSMSIPCCRHLRCICQSSQARRARSVLLMIRPA